MNVILDGLNPVMVDLWILIGSAAVLVIGGPLVALLINRRNNKFSRYY